MFKPTSLMEQHWLDELKRELINGSVKKGHPFRYFSLATVNGNQPKQRTVVLRKFNSDLSLEVYTDARSEKVQHIGTNDEVSALFYHPKKLLQLRIQGKAQFLSGEALKTLWRNIPENAKNDYITLKAPGTTIQNPDDIVYAPTDAHFQVLHIVPNSIEYLKLNRPHHLRILYTKVSNEWSGQFLVP